jgi:DNA-binding GntR family transcriptional regulator
MAVIRSTESQVLDILRTRILTGEYPIGARLRQSDIASDLHTSTTPVREALRDLAAEGLVQIDTHRGAVIRELSKDELIEVLELQLMVEIETLRHAVPNYSDAVLTKAESLHREMLACADPLQFTILNYEFHMALSEPSGRTRSLTILRTLFNVATVQITEDISSWDGRRAVGEADHAEMIAAGRERDVERMLGIIRRHTEPAIEHLR